MNEAETRAELIDPALHATGWGVVADDSLAARRRRLLLGAREPVDKSGVGALAGTPDCCLEHALQHRL